MQATGRKQRELYVGNLLVGVVTADKLKDFFTSILTQCPGYSPQMGPPVAVVQLSGEGKFAFVEFRDETIAITALQLDKLPLEGRPLNIGRPAGYQPAPGQPLPTPLPLPPSVSGSTAAGAPVDPAAAAAVAALVGGRPGAPSSGAPPPQPVAAARCRRPLPSQQAGGPPPRKQRELYVGNLAVGVVTANHLRELFRAPLLTMPNLAPEAEAGPLVINVDMSADGKFAFVEFREEQIATIALTLFDKMEVCGRALNVGRPRGYVEPAPGQLPGAAAAAAARGCRCRRPSRAAVVAPAATVGPPAAAPAPALQPPPPPAVSGATDGAAAPPTACPARGC